MRKVLSTTLLILEAKFLGDLEIAAIPDPRSGLHDARLPRNELRKSSFSSHVTDSKWKKKNYILLNVVNLDKFNPTPAIFNDLVYESDGNTAS